MRTIEFIYVVGANQEKGPYRIGRTQSPKKLLERLQEGYPFGKLTFLQMVRKEGHSIRGLEALIQDRLKEFRMIRGWLDVRFTELTKQIGEAIQEFDDPVFGLIELQRWRQKRRNKANGVE